MRKNLVAGALLAVGAGLMFLLGSVLELNLESVTLLGGALGAIVALVPDRTPWVRLGGFGAGFVIAWIGYIVRAAMLPDTSSGRAVAVIVVILLCALVAAATQDRLPLWTLLLGTAGLTGAYEFTYSTAPPELLTTSVDTATTLFLSVVVGFCAINLVALASGRSGSGESAHRGPKPHDDDTESLRLDEMMESSK